MFHYRKKHTRFWKRDTCHGNGYIRVATGDTSLDFRDNSQVHQCWDCDSEGEFYETVDVNDVPNDSKPH